MSRLSEPRTRPILIAGPTASGKSALAMAFAERIGGAIINADSMQVYREIPILSARPTAADEARVPHLLYGHVPASEPYSAGRFVREARDAIEAARKAGRVPIITGGTGLYFKALTEGLAPIPDIPAPIRQHWRREAERTGTEQLHAFLAARDPRMAARLAPQDTQRIVRALEVLEATGRSLADWQEEIAEPVLDPARAIRLVVLPDRFDLHRHAEARFDAMLERGALAEAEAFAALGLDPDLPAARALGLRPLMAHLAGDTTLAAAVAAAKAETRQYIKRQTTWIRSNMITWTAITAQETERIKSDIFAFIDHQP